MLSHGPNLDTGSLCVSIHTAAQYGNRTPKCLEITGSDMNREQDRHEVRTMLPEQGEHGIVKNQALQILMPDLKQQRTLTALTARGLDPYIMLGH